MDKSRGAEQNRGAKANHTLSAFLRFPCGSQLSWGSGEDNSNQSFDYYKGQGIAIFELQFKLWSLKNGPSAVLSLRRNQKSHEIAQGFLYFLKDSGRD